MSDTAFSTLYDDIRLDIPGAPDALIEQALNRTARFFCREVPVLRCTSEIWLIPDRADYILDIPANTVVGHIISLDYNDSLIPGTNETMLDKKDKGWRIQTGTTIENYLQPRLGTIRLYPIPEESEPDAIKAHLSLIPTRDATGFEENLMARYDDLLIDGALSWLFSRPSQKWESPQSALEYRAMHEIELERAAIDNFHNNVQSELSVRMKPLA